MFKDASHHVDYGETASAPFVCWIYDESDQLIHESVTHERARSASAEDHAAKNVPKTLEDCALKGHTIAWIMQNVPMQFVVENWEATFEVSAFSRACATKMSDDRFAQDVRKVYPDLQNVYAESAWRREASDAIICKFERSKRVFPLSQHVRPAVALGNNSKPAISVAELNTASKPAVAITCASRPVAISDPSRSTIAIADTSKSVASIAGSSKPATRPFVLRA